MEGYYKLYEYFKSKPYNYLDDIEAEEYKKDIRNSKIFDETVLRAETDKQKKDEIEAKEKAKRFLLETITKSNEAYKDILKRPNLTHKEKEIIKGNELSAPDEIVESLPEVENDQDIDEEDLPDLRGGNNNFLRFLNNSHRFYGTPH